MAQLINPFVMSPKVKWMDICINLHVRGGFRLWQSIWQSDTTDGGLNIMIYSCSSTWITSHQWDWILERHEVCVRYLNSTWQRLAPQSPLLYTLFPLSAHRIAGSIISSLLQHHYHAVFWSLRPSLKWSKQGTLQVILGFDVKNIRQWPLYEGVWQLHYLLSIVSSRKSPQGQTIKADDRGSRDVTVLLSSGSWRDVSQPVFTTRRWFHPRHTIVDVCVNRTVVNQTITMFWDIVAI